VTNKTLEQTSSGATLVIPRKVETLTSTHEIISATLNARVFFPLGRVQPYALGGAGIMHSQTTGNYRSYCIQTRNCSDTDPPLDAGSGILEDGFDFGFRAGGGLDFYVNENVVLNWEVGAVLPIGQLQNLNYYVFTWGLQYRF
ncbi:MAG: porin family protein, partial [Myxococcales bacterium]|nr:porin family protein [Myxococcales bacterium]